MGDEASGGRGENRSEGGITHFLTTSRRVLVLPAMGRAERSTDGAAGTSMFGAEGSFIIDSDASLCWRWQF
jgi:hypothetical protein